MKKNGKKKKGVALVFGITKDYTFALANVLIGLKEHNKKFWDDIIVYHDGVSKFDQDNINKILAVDFVDLSEAKHFKAMMRVGTTALEKYSIAAFYRYECLKLLDEYKKVIWNDVDILIQGDISGLLDCADGNGLAFSRALPQFVMGSSLKKLIEEYDMFAPLWNDGIMVFSDKLANYNEMYEWCINSTIQYMGVLLWPDLAILNLMLQEFRIEPENIDGDKYVCLPMSEKTKEAMILHAYGDKKFWNNLKYMKGFSEWTDNAVAWSRLNNEKKGSECPLVSCIMSCYERYDYLEESIISLLAQSYTNFEIIVVLEKSKTQEKIEEVLKDIGDDRIVIIKNKEKLGFPASLNVGIDAARGKYIARMDDDDISMPLRFALQVDYLEKHPDVGIVGSDMVVFGRENGFAPAFKDNDYIKVATLVESPFKHPTVMMRKEVLDKYNLRYDPDYFTEDYELWSRLVYKTKSANIPRSLVCYRSHNQQSTSSATSNNELKIHSSHKKVMFNQFKDLLGVDLTDNELELLQTRKSYEGEVKDHGGMVELREKAIEKIIKANDERRVYDSRILEYILVDRLPGRFKELTPNQLTSKEVEERVAAKSGLKRTIKFVLRPVVRPFYARLVDRMENIMIDHDKAVQADLQWQIDEMKRRG